MPNFFQRFWLALRAFFSITFSGQVPREVEAMIGAGPATRVPAPVTPLPSHSTGPERDTSGDGAVQMLALLQRDGRLVDFLMEDLTTYSDAQVGAAVRDVHASCRQVLSRYVTLEAVIAGEENQPVTVDSSTDPASIKLIGNVTGRPPFRGTLRHSGWRSTRVQLPPLADGAARAIVSPAEIEIP